jgi:hypothetical protein
VTRVCALDGCPESIDGRRPNARYHSEECRKEAWRRRQEAALRDPDPVSALTLTARLEQAEALSTSAAPKDGEDDRTPAEPSESVQDAFLAPPRPSEQPILSRLRGFPHRSAFSIDAAAAYVGETARAVTDALVAAGIRVQSDGIADGDALQRALSHDGLTMVERMVAARPPSDPVPNDYQPTRLDETEGLYALGRVMDNGGSPWEGR